MPKIRLTDRTIKALQPEANKRIEFHDTLEPALAIRVTQTGTKTFVFCYYWGRNTKRYTIGRYPAYSLVLARQRVSELRVQVSKGIDPSAEKSKNAKARAVQNKPVTISQLAKDFQAGHFSKLKPNTRKGYQSAIQSNIVAVLGNRPVKELTRSELRKFLKTFVVKGHTTTGNRIHAILSKMLNFAVDEEIIKTNPIAGLDKLSSESSRERTYTNEEIRALWDAIELETTPAREFLKMLLLTGQRRGEVTGMEWDHIEQAKKVWIIPADSTKNGREHTVPLCPTAWAIIEQMKTFDPGNKFVFNSTIKADTQISGFTQISNRIRKASGVKDFTFHDFRRTVASRLAEYGTPRHVLKNVLNHATGTRADITNVYDRYEYLNEKRGALTVWSEALQAIVSGKEWKGGNILPISQTGA